MYDIDNLSTKKLPAYLAIARARLHALRETKVEGNTQKSEVEGKKLQTEPASKNTSPEQTITAIQQ